MTKVIVRDELPGSGKSGRMIDEINNSPSDQKWIVVTPFLKECHRYAGTINDEDSGDKKLPLRDGESIIYTGEGCSASGRQLHHPTSGYKSKVENIGRLIHEGKDIVTTHAALKLFTPETVKDVRDAGYKLVIDEELECIRPHPVKAHRRKMLLSSHAVYEDELGLLRWNSDFNIDDTKDVDNTGYSWDMQIKALCDNGSLVLITDDNGDRDLFMWEYPIEFLKAFDEIQVLTYMFEGSVFQKYLDFNNIQHETKYGERLPNNPFELINIVDNVKMNKIGDRENIFSATDQKRYTKDSHVSQVVRNNLSNFFKNSTYGKTNTNDRLWTCLDQAFSIFKGAGYTKCHIAQNTKAVNDYRNTSQLAYIYNSYLHPEPYKYLKDRGDQYAPDGDRFALTELIQWVYRSRVRCKEPINLYLPSSRMRELLISWMNGKYT